MRREQVDHRLRGDQRHDGRDHRQQPQHRAPVGDQQDHDDDRQGRVQQRAVDALEHLAVVGRVPERAGDVGGQAVRVRCGDRADGVGGLRRVVPAFLAQIDLKDGLDGLAVGRRDRAYDLAGHDAVNSGEAPGVRGCLGPVRGGQTRGPLIDDDPGEDVRRLETRLHLKDLGRLRVRGQPGLRVVLLRTGELSRPAGTRRSSTMPQKATTSHLVQLPAGISAILRALPIEPPGSAAEHHVVHSHATTGPTSGARARQAAPGGRPQPDSSTAPP